MEWDKLAIVDLETTGMHPQHDRIIEIGIALIDHNHLTATYSQLINPKIYLPPEITRLTGIMSQELEQQPTFADIADTILAHLKDRLFVAHNVRFDYSFLKHEFGRYGLPLTLRHVCSARLSRTLFPRYRHHSLDSLIERFNLTVANRHRALGDALAVWDFFTKLPQHIDPPQVESALQKIVRTPALPTHLNPKLLASIPNSPGVYIFYDRDHCPLYVGKSIHVKSRILDHFYADLENNLELHLKDQLADIEVLPAAGELEALLMEADFVKKLQPVYNRQLRNHRDLVGLRLEPDSRGYLVVTLSHLDPEHLDPSSLYGIFRSDRQAKTTVKELVKDHQLCWGLTGLEKTKHACFGYHLGACHGACVGQEKPVAYNLRVVEAFAPRKLQTWPFPGPVTITEHDDQNGRTAVHLFDKWCHLGTGDTNTPEMKDVRYSFNLDNYRILRRYLEAHPHAPHSLR